MKKLLIVVLMFSVSLFGGDFQLVTPKVSAVTAQITLNVPLDIEQVVEGLRANPGGGAVKTTNGVQKLRCIVYKGENSPNNQYLYTQEVVVVAGNYTAKVIFNNIPESVVASLSKYQCNLLFGTNENTFLHGAGSWHDYFESGTNVSEIQGTIE